MLRYRLFLVLFFALFGFAAVVETYAQGEGDVMIYEKYADFAKMLRKTDENTVLVLNFWATWCGPCVKELPLFDSLSRLYKGSNVRVLLVSLDMKSKVEKVSELLAEKELLELQTVLLADQDADSWIQQIEQAWDGAIPFSLIMKGKRRAYHKGDFKNYNELEEWARPFFNGAKPEELTKR